LSDWSEAQIVSLAEPSASDVEEAAAAWREVAPLAAKRLLDAVEEEFAT
jgi:hypothetical protein